MSANDAARPPTTVIRWVLDTRGLWPEAKETSQLKDVASRALDLLSESERAGVLRYCFVKDAKLSLGSMLLKRFVIAKFCGVPWAKATPVRDARTKPVFLMADGSEPLLFNVSHQAGLVALVAVHNPRPGLAVGVDVVCQGERADRDRRMVATEGWPRFVEVHDEVLSPREAARLKRLPLTAADRRLAYFYALWCLREAYVKMTGDALLAPWLHDLEMRSFAPPGEVAPAMPDDDGHEYPHELEVWFRGSKVTDVDMTLTKLLDEYMISTAVRRAQDGTGLEPGDFSVANVEDILTEAEGLRDYGE